MRQRYGRRVDNKSKMMLLHLQVFLTHGREQITRA